MIINIGKYILFFFAIIIIFGQCNTAKAQSLSGIGDSISIPTGYIPNHGEVYIGTNWLDKRYLSYGSGGYNVLVNYANIGYLPFLQIALRATRLMNHPEPHTIGDRMVIMRLRPLKESRYFPSVVLGAHDFITTNFQRPTNNFNTLYIVASKSLKMDPLAKRLELHLGHGSDWMKAKNHEFVGLFGGISLTPRQFVTLMAEYDGKKPNIGLRFNLFNHINILLCLLKYDSFSFGMNYRFNL